MTIESCELCPRRCKAVRSDSAGSGFCRMPAVPKLARVAPHMWEEPCVSGTRGAGAVFFSGCTLRCCFCQNEPISAGGFGQAVSVDGLRECFAHLKAQDVHTINLVNPVHFMPAVRQVLLRHSPGLPVVWNSGGYERVETLRAMDGLVDVYLPDLKYVDGELSDRLSGAADYFEHASAALLEMARQTGEPSYNEEGILQKGLIVRHLILPGHTKDSLRVLDWIASELPRGTVVSLMCQYVPMGRVEGHKELTRRLTQREYDKVIDRLFALGLENGYVQEMDSASSRFTPAFDLTGVPGDTP